VTEDDMEAVINLIDKIAMPKISEAINEDRARIRFCLAALEQLRGQVGELEDDLLRLRSRS
jgi:hypothetical protein